MINLLLTIILLHKHTRINIEIILYITPSIELMLTYSIRLNAT